MEPSNYTKNPCKICFQTVNKKSGVQCHGVCKKWVHYSCLDYTPGKISDIRAGFIKIMCPCPDCSSNDPKEIVMIPSYTCPNVKCPANNVPVCDSLKCPVNNPPKECSIKTCSKSFENEECPSIGLQKSKSCYMIGSNDFALDSLVSTYQNVTHPGASLSDSRCNMEIEKPMSTINPSTEFALKQMCKTVNDLTRQVQELLGKFSAKH